MWNQLYRKFVRPVDHNSLTINQDFVTALSDAPDSAAGKCARQRLFQTIVDDDELFRQLKQELRLRLKHRIPTQAAVSQELSQPELLYQMGQLALDAKLAKENAALVSKSDETVSSFGECRRRSLVLVGKASRRLSLKSFKNGCIVSPNRERSSSSDAAEEDHHEERLQYHVVKSSSRFRIPFVCGLKRKTPARDHLGLAKDGTSFSDENLVDRQESTASSFSTTLEEQLLNCDTTSKVMLDYKCVNEGFHM